MDDSTPASAAVGGVTIRPATREDLPSIVDLCNRAEPWRPMPFTSADFEQGEVFLVPGGLDVRVVATLGASPGAGIVGHGWIRDENWPPDALYMLLWVDPGGRRQGIGTALLDRLLEGAIAAGGRREVAAFASERSEPGMAFAVARGFVEHYRMVEWEVDPSNFDFDGHPARAIPDGLRITTLAEVDGPAVRHALHEMLLEATADVPTPDAVPPSSYDEWQRELFGMPRFAAEGLILAMERGRPVAACCVTVDGLNAWTHFTAVARSHRGRGLAWNVKLASLRLTRERGVRSLRTTNHTANAGMLAINEGLGFRRVPGTVRYGRDL